ncbi:KTSC domain-containing protein [Serratia fonticola]|nr:KTSC domain-containing protein [Serratia fonticola]
MIRQPVSSSNLISVGYDAASRTLEVEFLSGEIYQYSGVPLGVYQSLMHAPSKGGYFSSTIRNYFPNRHVW